MGKIEGKLIQILMPTPPKLGMRRDFGSGVAFKNIRSTNIAERSRKSLFQAALLNRFLAPTRFILIRRTSSVTIHLSDKLESVWTSDWISL